MRSVEGIVLRLAGRVVRRQHSHLLGFGGCHGGSGWAAGDIPCLPDDC